MPVYDYRCQDCGYEFDVRQSFSADPITDCPNCKHKNTVFRVIHPAGVVFKGSGWYVTDSRASRENLNGKSNGNGSSDSSSSDTSSETKTESKSETKAEKPATTSSAAD